jgi:hypothetical protein
MDLTLISLLRIVSGRELSCSFRQLVDDRIQYAFTASRDWTWLLDWGQSCSKLAATPGLRTGVAIARFKIVRARFNKRSTPVFPKEKSSFEYPQCAAP